MNVLRQVKWVRQLAENIIDCKKEPSTRDRFSDPFERAREPFFERNARSPAQNLLDEIVVRVAAAHTLRSCVQRNWHGVWKDGACAIRMMCAM